MTSQEHVAPQLSLAVVQDNLSRIGYDIEPAQPGVPPNASVVARRDLGDRAILVAIDTGGRFRIDISRTVEEWSQPDSIAGISVRVVETVSRSLTLTGQIGNQEEAGRLIAALTNLNLVLNRPGAAFESLNQNPKPQN
jgi:hypothetical protein